MKCPECDAYVVGLRYCLECGYDTKSESPNYCGNCGDKYVDKFDYCLKCGKVKPQTQSESGDHRYGEKNDKNTSIKEEEYERARVRKEIEAKETAKNFFGGLVVLVVIGALVYFFLYKPAVDKYTPTSGESERIKLGASVEVREGAVHLQNRDPFHWNNVEVRINPNMIGFGGYTYGVSSIRPHQVVSVPLGEFSRSSGERFNIHRVRINNIWIFADTPSGRSSAGFEGVN